MIPFSSRILDALKWCKEICQPNFNYCIPSYKYLSPADQSNFSHTKSSEKDLFRFQVQINSDVLINFAEKLKEPFAEKIALQKLFTFFFNKKWLCFWVEYVWKFKFSFDQLGPGYTAIHTSQTASFKIKSGQWIISSALYLQSHSLWDLIIFLQQKE